MRAVTLLALLLLSSCLGQDAADAAICRDFIHRVCLAPVCSPVTTVVGPGLPCETTLLARTGCASEEFAFKSPSRDKFLGCRLPLLRTSENREGHPGCENVTESFDRCPEVVRMLQGLK